MKTGKCGRNWLSSFTAAERPGSVNLLLLSHISTPHIELLLALFFPSVETLCLQTIAGAWSWCAAGGPRELLLLPPLGVFVLRGARQSRGGSCRASEHVLARQVWWLCLKSSPLNSPFISVFHWSLNDAYQCLLADIKTLQVDVIVRVSKYHNTQKPRALLWKRSRSVEWIRAVVVMKTRRTLFL